LASARAKGVVAPFQESWKTRESCSSLQVAACVLVKDCTSTL